MAKSTPQQPSSPSPKTTINTINGGDRDDILYGTLDKDLISGGKGDDIIDAGKGDDTVMAGDGNDVIIHNINDNVGARDYYDGGTGGDTLQLVVTQEQYDILQKALLDFNKSDKSQVFDFSRYSKDINLKIVNIEHITFEIVPPVIQFQASQSITTNKDGTLIGTNLNDMLVGGAGNDDLFGKDGNDRLVGGEGNDHLIGGNGNDDLIGGAGDDCINAGAGNDVINGSAGVDTVVHFVDENQGFHDYYQDSGTSVQNDGQDTLVLVFSDSDYAKLTSLINTMETDFANAKKNGVVFDFSQYDAALARLGVSKTLTLGTKGFEKLEIINATEAQHRADQGEECYGEPHQNHTPIALQDSFSMTEDNAFTSTSNIFNLGNKLANDSDPDGNPLHLVSLQNVRLDTTHASSPFDTMTITLVDGSFKDGNGSTVLLTMGGQTATLKIDMLGNETLYDPNHLFNALSTNESLIIKADYTITDGNLTSVGTQSITITGTNDAPVAVNDAYTTDEDIPLIVPAAGILGNDDDIDGDALSAVLETGP
ncbi:MAG: hypothetical protein K0R52_1446, partial [Alphaproteobacteria bacterium]|nr:hypothetical protein [Alphaproteobacteria bacterium]